MRFQAWKQEIHIGTRYIVMQYFDLPEVEIKAFKMRGLSQLVKSLNLLVELLLGSLVIVTKSWLNVCKASANLGGNAVHLLDGDEMNIVAGL